MLYKHVIDALEKYSFVSKVEYGKDFYVKVFYKVNGEERHRSITRRANNEQLISLIKKIKDIADKPPDPKLEPEIPFEIVKYEGE